MEFREIMRATQAPDVYAGEACNSIEPRWIGSADGDKDGDGPVGRDGVISLAARTFPPGTVISIQSPECPECGEVPSDMGDLPDGKGGWYTSWKCGCAFDWRAFTLDTFS